MDEVLRELLPRAVKLSKFKKCFLKGVQGHTEHYCGPRTMVIFSYLTFQVYCMVAYEQEWLHGCAE